MKTKEIILFIDDETYSPVDVKTRGAWNYAKEAGILLISYRFSHWKPGRVEFVTNWDREKLRWQDLPKEIKEHKGPVVAHNLFFEHAIHTHVLPFVSHLSDASVYRCTAATSRRMGLPGDLYSACKALGLKNQKDKGEGDKLIKKYSSPDPKTGLYRKITEEDAAAWIRYGRGDVLAMEELYETLPKLHEDKFEWPVFQADKVINLRGWKVDRKAVEEIKSLYEKAVKIVEKKAEKLCGREKSGTLTVSSPVGFVRWIGEQGEKIENAQAFTLEELSRKTKNKAIKTAISYRKTLAAAAPKKLEAFLNYADADGIVRHSELYFGAHTGRWAGRGIQPHNLPRETADDWKKTLREVKAEVKSGNVESTVEKINSLIRGCIVPHISFAVSDFSAIEARALFYLSGCRTGLNIYKQGKNPYLEMGEKMFGRKIKKEETREYTLAKNAVLGLGYGMGKDRFFDYCKFTGQEIDLAFAEKTVRIYRDTFEEVPGYWRECERNFMRVLSGGKVDGWTLSKDKSFLRLTLPSGRAMYYFKPRIEDNKIEVIGNYGGIQKLWGGVIVENIVQGYARDLLAHSILEAEKAKLYVSGHVHDEIIVDATQPEKNLKILEKIMSTPPAWAPGFPLKCEAKIMSRYGK